MRKNLACVPVVLHTETWTWNEFARYRSSKQEKIDTKAHYHAISKKNHQDEHFSEISPANFQLRVWSKFQQIHGSRAKS